MNKLVTFGDSFLAQYRYFPKLEPTSWIDFICEKNNFKLHGFGDPGTGPYNAVMNFMNYRKDFDICFFAWSEIFRDFYPHRTLAGIAKGKSSAMGELEKMFIPTTQKEFSNFNTEYNLNKDFETLRVKATLEYLDKHLQKHYSDKKFIHFYCLSKYGKYPYTFKHGINILPLLSEFANIDKPKDMGYDNRPLHMAPKVHKSFARQLNDLLNDDSLNNGDTVEFDIEH